MPSFHGLYVYSRGDIHFDLRSEGRGPVSCLCKPTALPIQMLDEKATAMMVNVAQNPTPREIESRRVIPLQEILNNMPTTLRSGFISWLILEGEEEPTTLIIHQGLSMEGLARLGELEIGTKAFETYVKNYDIFDFFKGLGKARAVRKAMIEDAGEQAKKSKLANTEPVAHYIDQSYSS